AVTSQTREPNPGDYPDLSGVPPCYHDLREVFIKEKSHLSAPLLPGAPIPKARLDSISSPERKAMDEYIEASLSSLNNIMVKNRHPLPLISSAFDQLQQAKMFTKLDLWNAYHLVRIREGDEWKTGFNTPTGHYEYLVMPFRLTKAPAVFQGFINEILRDYLNDFVFVYLDDILIFSPDPVTHQHHVRQVLIHLLENQLYVKAEKCKFHTSSVSFLGFIVIENQVKMDPEKISAVTNWLTSRKKVQQFLGFANFYRKFIRNFSAVAAPLHALTSPKVPFQWGSRAEEALTTYVVVCCLCWMFTSAPVLTMPDPQLQFIVEVDASNEGVGAVLSQCSPQDQRIHPCGFLSRKLSPAERNYDVGNQELLAIKVALEELRHWLEGAEQPFIVWTDHKNLQYLRTAKRLNSRQASLPTDIASDRGPQFISWFQVVHGYQQPLFPANEEEVTVPSAHSNADADQRPRKDEVRSRSPPPSCTSLHTGLAGYPPSPRVVDGGPVCKVKKLLVVRKRGGGRQFLVDWEGYGSEERSWIPTSFIVDDSLIDDT
ncbi:hypothetical protein L3Q82_018436, partial [Scortum barcoo]